MVEMADSASHGEFSPIDVRTEGGAEDIGCYDHLDSVPEVQVLAKNLGIGFEWKKRFKLI